MDLLRGTFEHCSNVPLRAMFNSTPREITKPDPLLNRGADKSLARPGRKQAAPVKIVMGRGMD